MSRETLFNDVTPAHNEKVVIIRVVSQVKKYVNKVVVFDDGSVDATSNIAERSGGLLSSVPKPRRGNMGLKIDLLFSL